MYLQVSVANHEFVFEGIETPALKALETLVLNHWFQNRHKHVQVFPEFQKPFYHQYFVIHEHVWIQSSQYIYVLRCQFERTRLEIYSSWTSRKHESEVYVDQVALVSQQYISVMSKLIRKYHSFYWELFITDLLNLGNN
jgi:hypothetical protein